MSYPPHPVTRGPSDRSEPVELRAPRGASRLSILWTDGSITEYRHALLRGFCPCAHCQGHQGPIRWAEAATEADLPLLEVEEVGNYALRLVWGDGHGTGLYTFAFLKRLAPLALRSLEDRGLSEVKAQVLSR